ncbi:aspartate ammonia-lyase [Tindallia magadiensis]|uniref:aspartate ammonia-lyase n=1 Tax=Tindallia magadiensis TaxID=69895 RepID=A0A1I3AE28_9FIRM|nr:aspartate ammonia-lyase [Tindallia magadiensis]SFH47979.1 aspartate ammonia-lyase [Tindallia magadiensis]
MIETKLNKINTLQDVSERNINPEVRLESDSLGSMEIPSNAYYGIQSKRAQENFPLPVAKVHPELIRSMGKVKYACVCANLQTNTMPEQIGSAIKKACIELINGEFDEQIIVESIQGGAGTSINMNVNEVLANRALEILRVDKGRYDIVSPNTHVNMAQSTNDVVPTAFKVSVLSMEENLINSLEKLFLALKDKEQELDDVLVMGRTHLQDALPIRLGQEFGAYSRVLRRDIDRIKSAMKSLSTVNLGATAVGTGLNADPVYIQAAIEELCSITGLNLEVAEHLVDGTQNTDGYIHLSSALKNCALSLSKMANDLRMKASGPSCGLMEINLPPVQPGSSIMPGKVNPVMAEMMNQICFQVQGNDHTVSLASGAGQFELNVMGPVLFKNLFESIDIITHGAEVFAVRCIEGITANKEACKEKVENSVALATALNPHLGYEATSSIAKEVLKSKRSVREVTLEKGLLSEADLDEIMQPKEMTEPGIAGKHLIGIGVRQA